MRVKRMRRVWRVLGALAVEVAQGDCPVLKVAPVQTIAIDRRSWPQRFVRSYLGWRKCLGIVASLRAAWAISRVSMPPDAVIPALRSRLGRDWFDVSGGKLSGG
jgi:hypothetical protein